VHQQRPNSKIKNNMEENLTPEQQKNLIKQLSSTKRELEVLRNQTSVQQISAQDKFIETLFEKGGEIMLQYTKMNSETQKFELEKLSEIDKQELNIINKIDTKEKLYKGVLITITIVTLVIVSIYVEKAQMIIPVISLIMGLLLKTNSVTDFIAFRKKNKNEIDE